MFRFWPTRDTDPATGTGTVVQEEPAEPVVSLVPRAWFGTATTPLPDPAGGDEDDPDDEELDETPPDVLAMLGFDPKDMADDGADPPSKDDGDKNA